MNKRILWVVLIIIVILVVVGFVLPASERVPVEDPADEEPLLPSVSANGNMKVWWPWPGVEVMRPLRILGEARVFENALSYRVRNNSGEIIAEGFTTASAPDIGQFGPFVVSVPYEAQAELAGTVEVFAHSAKDGSVIELVSIPVKLAQVESTAVAVYFGNAISDPEVQACERTYPSVRIVPKTTAVAREALEQLLSGPTEVEQELGFFTSIQDTKAVKIQSLTIKDGVATVDLSAALSASAGGSCRVVAVRSQIINTLLQFETVDEVVISVEGETDEVLQP
ncbi:MAG: hypothetical protein COU11_02225 [Candidatus Harrisonbacteria bacterium CG10_big_fil_rev_8_21_14_0_10_49_15]|uniref:GerMN domain-containing protein n=1 Tax=Candidatus Harrisonbacteria bacterium CG10_big_fil_rev_8_21_14_0_10_49_15 TaxID=1974587 RepID=A0A2H0UKT6_9BACT|nr:MAG: hypothetical protein COU11_02225 [Candidatus Harrisonbacteria bacterium CG10_big_fil_rev_8_21_14_0_10_49_15]